uniref:DEAD domain-containing protein n=1 Tax=Rhabditophanes sp. KR3021 TaxID=114890 RepID=A0AC35TJG5_9BILA
MPSDVNLMARPMESKRKPRIPLETEHNPLLNTNRSCNFNPFSSKYYVADRRQKFPSLGYQTPMIDAIMANKGNLTPTPSDLAISSIIENTDVKHIRLHSELTDECVFTYLIPMLKVLYSQGANDERGIKKKRPYALILTSNPDIGIAVYECIHKFLIDGNLPFRLKLAHQKFKLKDVIEHIQYPFHILITTHATLNNLLVRSELSLDRCNFIVLQSVDMWIQTNMVTDPIKMITDLYSQMKSSGLPNDNKTIYVATADKFDELSNNLCEVFSKAEVHYDVDMVINEIFC